MIQNTQPRKRVLSVFSLVMINVIAVDSLRTLPPSAEYGFSLITYYALATMLFFLPTAFCTAELATAWPKNGGIYVWVREAFGKQTGFFVVWLQWIYNVVWYPTILSFVAAMIAYCVDPALIQNKAFMITSILVLYWGAAFANFFGMEVSGWISALGALLGTLFPMLVIIGLAAYWLASGNPVQISMNWDTLWPQGAGIGHFVLLTTILYGLIGLDMSAVHAQEVKTPERDYPRALLISATIILFSLTLASLSVAIVVPQSELSLVAGIIQAFQKFFDALNLPQWTQVFAVLMALGALSSVAAWIIGPSKAMLAAATDGELPKIFSHTNAAGVPVPLMLLQGGIFSVLALSYLLMPSVASGYWLLTALTAQMSLLMYVIMFAALIRLRYKYPDVVRPYKIPFGNVGVWLVGGFGALTSFGVIILGFFPPEQIDVGDPWRYVALLLFGLLIFCSPPIIIHRLEKARRPFAVRYRITPP